MFCGNSYGQAFAIDKGGNLWSWGLIKYYRNLLGRENASSEGIYTPDVVAGVHNVVSVGFDGYVALVLTDDGTPYWFGHGNHNYSTWKLQEGRTRP